MAVSAHIKKTCLRSEEHREQLLPGICNEVTLDLITPKLSWKVLRKLACVSRCWQEAIRTNEVYDARVRAKSTETLIVHCHRESGLLALYSTSEKRCHELPPIPGLPRLALRSCQLIALRGKLYVLRGRLRPGMEVLMEELDLTSPDIYVLDLVGQRQWEQCASMREARSRYACGVMDGKLYVFGGVTVGTSGFRAVLGAEVYDPQGNKWSPIMQMTQGRYSHDVATVGKELVLYNGKLWLGMLYKTILSPDSRTSWGGTKEMPLGVYNPAKNEWRLIELFGNTISPVGSRVFVAKEKFYLLSQSGIDVYDANQKSWVNCHANSFATDEPEDSVLIALINVLAVNDELVLVGWWRYPRQTIIQSFHCKGLDSAKKELLWQKTNCSDMTRAICSILL